MDSLLTKPGPLEFRGNVSKNWKTWKREFDIYIQALDLQNKSAATKSAIFLNLIGREGREVADNFQTTSDQEETIETLTEKFKQYCNPRKNTMYTRYKLWNMKKLDEETVDQFSTRLQQVAKDGAYGDQEKNMVRDRIVFGIKDDGLRERILEKDDIPLEKVLDMVRAHEICKAQMKKIKQTDDAEISQVLSSNMQIWKKRDGRSDSHKICDYCGLRHEPRACPAYGKICHTCKKLNHFANVCRARRYSLQQTPRSTEYNKKQNKSHKVSEIKDCSNTDDSSSEEFFAGEIKLIGALGTQWYQEADLNGTKITFKLDTGAEVNVLPTHIYTRLKGHPKINRTNTKLKAYGGQVIIPIGYTEIETNIGRQKQKLTYIVADVTSGPVLGLDACKTFKLIMRKDTHHKHENEQTEEIRKMINANFTDEQEMLQEFAEVFQGIGCYKGQTRLTVRPHATPIVHAPRKIPISLQQRLLDTLKELENEKIIQKVEYPTDWVNSMVVKEKRDGKLRICIDPRDLNKALKREHYRIPTADEIYSRLKGKKFFTVMDQKCGYWNIELDDKSSDLCTFNTPSGRYRFNRLPFGLSVAPEIFQRRNDKEFGDLPGVGISTDDFIIAGETKQECLENVRRVLERAKQTNTKFNKNKIQFCKQEVKYLGNTVSANGIAMDPEKIRAISDLKPPTNVTEVRSLLGLATYLTPFIPNLPDLTALLRQIIKQKEQFEWTETHNQALTKLKEAIINGTKLRHFDPEKKITVQTDASQHGLGGCLMQENNPIAYTSRALQPHEIRYAQIEKEFLAIVNACEKFHYYTYGHHIEVHTDHKPLIAIIDKPIDKITKRLQRFVLRLQKYNVKLIYKPGPELVIADLLSRNFDKAQMEGADPPISKETIHEISNADQDTPKLTDKWQKHITQAIEQDEESQQLIKLTKNGWPLNKKHIPTPVQRYWNIRHNINYTENLILIGKKIFVPTALRSRILKLLHEAHQGMEKSKARARQIIYWPGMTTDIENSVARCSVCQQFRSNNMREPLMPHPIPDMPWEKLAMDFFEIGATPYLLIVDYYSRYPEINKIANKTAREATQICKEIFGRHGIPKEIICDNMPFNSTHFREFCSNWGIKLTTSSPRYPQSNGMAERFVQTVKKKIMKATIANIDKELVLLEYRNTPITGLPFSPAQLLMSRTLRTKLPITQNLLRPKLCANQAENMQTRQANQKKYFDRGTKTHKQLQIGDKCRIRDNNQWNKAQILSQADEPRSYWVMTEQGNKVRRNRRHLLATKEKYNLTPNYNNLYTATPEEDESTSATTEQENIGHNINNQDHQYGDEETTESKIEKGSEEQNVETNKSEPGWTNTPYTTRAGRTIRRPSRLRDFF